MKLTTEQITKLKVTEIRDELKLRGLDQSGTKALLISRLIANVEKEADAEEAATLTEAPAAEPSAFPVKTEQTKTEKKEDKATAGPDEDGEIKPKHKPIVYNITQKDGVSVKADEEAKKKRRAERFGIVDASEQEAKKLKARSERFNLKIPETEASKMEQRAKRFAQPQGAIAGRKDSKGHIDLSHIVTPATMTEEEKKKRRAERFGMAKN